MALIKQPMIANIPTIRIPDDKPTANISNGIKPINPKSKIVHPTIVRVLPMFASNRQLNFFEVFTVNPSIFVVAIAHPRSLKGLTKIRFRSICHQN